MDYESTMHGTWEVATISVGQQGTDSSFSKNIRISKNFKEAGHVHVQNCDCVIVGHFYPRLLAGMCLVVYFIYTYQLKSAFK